MRGDSKYFTVIAGSIYREMRSKDIEVFPRKDQMHPNLSGYVLDVVAKKTSPYHNGLKFGQCDECYKKEDECSTFYFVVGRKEEGDGTIYRTTTLAFCSEECLAMFSLQEI